jgi:hypothetical protein
LLLLTAVAAAEMAARLLKLRVGGLGEEEEGPGDEESG